ncbi:MAG TPA: hypothetical protein VNG89_14010 [Vicinamibacterales bacterium]|nr:hypothetical protein [Vicinamibacterales bacterium]
MKPPTRDDEFYIGYAPPMPPLLASFVRHVVIAIAILLVAWAGLAATGHVRLDGGTFAFGHPEMVSGTIVARPFPVLKPDHDEARARSWPLLVAPGKHGADSLVTRLDGRHVTFMGTRIERGAHAMIEIDPVSLESARQGEQAAAAADAPQTAAAARAVELTGEIVDSKCFLGVMVPGSGKTHKDCAALCLRGGIPPALHVQDRSGRSSLLLMTGASGESISDQAQTLAGEALVVTGTILRQAGWLVLRTDPGSWR